MCAIANDGVLMRPTLVDHIESADGSLVSRNKAQKMKKLCDDSDAKIMKKLMRQVVKDGTGHALQNDDYSVAGKTGTAETGKGEDHSWFVGFSNVKDPDLVVCVLVEHGGAGSEVAAPIADEIFESYYENEMDKQYRMGEVTSKENTKEK
jgi:peptidoglycan glycosyltransferase